MRDSDLLPKAFKVWLCSTVVSPMGVRINCMVADALRYTQEASFPRLIAESMRVRAPFRIQIVPSSNWIGRNPAKVEIWVRIPLELLFEIE